MLINSSCLQRSTAAAAAEVWPPDHGERVRQEAGVSAGDRLAIVSMGYSSSEAMASGIPSMMSLATIPRSTP